MAKAGENREAWMAADLKFHHTLLWMTGNEMLGSLGALIETALIMSFRLSEGNPRGQQHALPLHAAVLEAVRVGDAMRARDAMFVLLADARKDVASVLGISKRKMAAVRGALARGQRGLQRKGRTK
jgi:DNA-binding FadR family transcriptional regulator